MLSLGALWAMPTSITIALWILKQVLILLNPSAHCAAVCSFALFSIATAKSPAILFVAERALENMNYQALNGRPMRIMWSHR